MNAGRPAPERARTSADVVRDAILRGELHPGQWLVESDVAERLEVPRSSVRQALLELQSERLIERQPNRGARVRVVGIDEAMEIMEVRSKLEATCAARAAERATADDRRRLHAIADDLRSAVAAGDILTYGARSEDLHGYVRELSDQATLQRLLAQLRNQTVRYHFRITLLPGYPARSVVEHLEVIDAITSGEVDLAEDVMLRHLHSVRDALGRLGERGGG